MPRQSQHKMAAIKLSVLKTQKPLHWLRINESALQYARAQSPRDRMRCVPRVAAGAASWENGNLWGIESGPRRCRWPSHPAHPAHPAILDAHVLPFTLIFTHIPPLHYIWVYRLVRITTCEYNGVLWPTAGRWIEPITINVNEGFLVVNVTHNPTLIVPTFWGFV